VVIRVPFGADEQSPVASTPFGSLQNGQQTARFARNLATVGARYCDQLNRPAQMRLKLSCLEMGLDVTRHAQGELCGFVFRYDFGF
jgi:hypothetical protein